MIHARNFFWILGICLSGLSASAQVFSTNPGFWQRMSGGVGLNLDFTQGSLPLQVRFTRDSGANVSPGTYFNSSGNLVFAPRNLILYSQDFSNTWSAAGTATISANNTTAPDGTNTANLISQTDNTANATQSSISMGSGAGTYVFSIYLKKPSSSICTNSTKLQLSGPTYSGSVTVNLTAGTTATDTGTGGNPVAQSISSVGSGWYRASLAITDPGATTMTVRIYPSSTGNETCGILAWGAQVESGSTPTALIYTSNITAYGPRFDYDPSALTLNGLLIENASTNSIRNNTMQGASAGTPGTLPTNWSQYTPNALNYRVVAVGTTATGISYIDYRIYGTPTATGFANLGFESASGIAASNGQSWSNSVYLAVVGGSTTGFTSISYQTAVNDSGPTYLGEITNTPFALSLTSTLTRYQFTGAVSNASAAYVGPYLQFRYTNGVAVDLTVRIGLPQIEQSAGVTSVIPTSGTALTRKWDIATVNDLSWVNGTQGTIFNSFRVPQITSTNAAPYSLTDAGGNNNYRQYINTGVNYWQVNAAGALTYGRNQSTVTANTNVVTSIGLQASNFASSLNGAAVATGTTGAMPSGMTVLYIGQLGNSNFFLNGWVRYFKYYPTRMNNSVLQAGTPP